jgi:23S rRNA pseudouridine1911/1915/1917 synthase
VKKGDRLQDSEALDCTRLERLLAEIRRGDPAIGVPVIAEAPGYTVVDKPAGVKSHPLGLFDTATVTHWALAAYPEVAAAFAECLPTVTPHRLDTGTSGVLVACHNPDSFRLWRERFHRKEVRKSYEAWCWGAPRQKAYSIEVPVAHASGDRRRMIVVTPTARFVPPILPSHSEIRVLEVRPGGCFRVEVECRTGVTHQVRVHLAHLGFPLVGDKLYDPQGPARSWRPGYHLLRARRLEWEGTVYEADMTEFRTGSGGIAG